MIDSNDWASYFAAADQLEDHRNIATIKKIQADALRYAANMSGDGKNIVLLAMAEELDPQPPHLKP